MNENDNFKVRDYAPDKDYDTLTKMLSELPDYGKDITQLAS